jgi:hypothetical protein
VDHKAEKQQGMIGSVVAMAAAWAAKAGMSYIGERMRTAAIQKAHEESHAHTAPTTPAPSSFNAPIMH